MSVVRMMGASVQLHGNGMLLPSCLGPWFAVGCWDRAGSYCRLHNAKS